MKYLKLAILLCLFSISAAAQTANAGADKTCIAGQVCNITCSGGTTYSWTQTVGTTVTINNNTNASANFTSPTPSGANEQLTLQCSIDGGASTDTIDIGIVKVNADGTIDTDDAVLDVIFGPLLPYGSAGAAVMPFYDVNQEASYAVHNNFPIRAPRDEIWNVGTVSTTNGNPIVTGSGTLFTKEVTPEINLYINGVTYSISSIDSDTQITLTGNASATITNTTVWGQNNNGEEDNYQGYWNYYRSHTTAYEAFYRTGLTKWGTVGDKIADSWWSFSGINYGARDPSDFNSPRLGSVDGLMIRAKRGKPEYWDWINRWVDLMFRGIWVTPRLNYPGVYIGVRDGGYSLLYAIYLSQALPNTYTKYANGTLAASTGTETNGATLRAAWFDESLNAATNYYARLQSADGSIRWLADWDFDADEDEVTDGYAEQSFHVGIGVAASWRTLMKIIEGNPTYQAEYNTMRQALIMNSAEVMGVHYSRTPVTDTPSINSRFAAYEAYSLFRWGADGMPDTLPAWPCLNGCGDIGSLQEARHNICTWVHVPAFVYHTTGVPQFKSDIEELLSASWGKTGYSGSIGVSDGQYAPMDDFDRTGTPHRSLKEYNEWYIYGNEAFAYRHISPSVPTNLPPLVTAGRDRRITAGTTPSFTVRAIDPEGTSLTYLWTAPTYAACPSITISDSTTDTVTVTGGLTNGVECHLQVAVTDADGKTTRDWINIRAFTTPNENQPPVANVTSQNVNLTAGTTSSGSALNASSSTDNEGDTIHYRWYQTSGAASTISNTKVANPTLSGLAAGTYTYRVFIYDDVTRMTVESGTDAIDVRVVVAASSSGNRTHGGGRKISGGSSSN